MFKLQHQFNNVIKITQLTNDQMPKFRCNCECSKCPPPAPNSNTSFQSLTWEIFHNLVDRSFWQIAPDNMKRFLTTLKFNRPFSYFRPDDISMKVIFLPCITLMK